MNEIIYNYIISLGFEEIGTNLFKKQEITINFSENAFHLSFYLDPLGDITLVNKINENRISDSKIINFIEAVNFIKNKLY
jgi:hypothetical protein